MFSGIIEELGSLESISKRGNIWLFTIRAAQVLEDTKIGDSIALNGVCLTVVKKDSHTVSFEVMGQTREATNLKFLKASEKVNLERSLKIGDRLSGHFVTGHIDCIGNIRRKSYVKNNLSFEIALPAGFLKFVSLKGSIAVDGISLTVMDKASTSFKVYIIPHTLKNTTLSFKGPSDRVNIELDILTKRLLP